jgi:hypothetical protein
MASASTIGRLHRAEEQKPQLRLMPQPEEHIKTANFANLQNDVSAPAPERRMQRFRRFRSTSPSPEAGYQLDPAMILSSVGEAAAVDRAAAFQPLAEREQILRLARAHLRSGPRRAGYPL